MIPRPSDRAIAEAFWELHENTRSHFAHSGKKQAADSIEAHAREIDAKPVDRATTLTTPEALAVLDENAADLCRCAPIFRESHMPKTADEFDKASAEISKARAHLTSRIAELEAELAAVRADAERGREIAAAFLPVMEAMRPLVLNLERLKDAAREGK